MPRILATTISLLLPLAAAACSPWRDAPDPVNVLLITVDTLRADHLGAYGYDQPTSPAIDELARQGSVVARCVASAPETAPAAASILTGLYQDRHLVTHNRASLPRDVQTMAERFRAAGYTTAAFVGNHLLGKDYGFDAGFESFEEFEGPLPISARDHLGAARISDWLHAAPDRPWFAWIHFMDPHGPYSSAEESASSAFTYDEETFGADRPLAVSQSNFGLGVLPRYQRIEGYTRPSQYFRRYDGEIRFTDAQVARVLEALSAAGLAGSTLVVLTADHGESLIEHDEYFQHGWFLYDTTLRVPLIFRQPGRVPPARHVEAQVSAVDIAPTILQLAGLRFDAEEEELDGVSFADSLLGRSAVAPRPAFAYGPRDNHPFAISVDGKKLIHTPAGTSRDPAARERRADLATPERYELYDIDEDPAEIRDLIGMGHALEGTLRDRLRQFELTFSQRFWQRKQQQREVGGGASR